MSELAILMPVFNEAEALEFVLSEWMVRLRQEEVDFQFFCFDDGSTDATPELLSRFSQRWPELRVVSKPNTGHGPTCLLGYHYILANCPADWIFQLDSDGQCDPLYFESVWRKRTLERPVYGWRTSRGDGWSRSLISKLLSLALFLATGEWIRDANVPYRLFHRDHLRTALRAVPGTPHLANVLVALHSKMTTGIHWVPIHFRPRSGGEPSVKLFGFARAGWVVFWQALRFARILRQGRGDPPRSDRTRPA